MSHGRVGQQPQDKTLIDNLRWIKDTWNNILHAPTAGQANPRNLRRPPTEYSGARF